MYPSSFDYHRPTSVPDAVKLLKENPDAKLLAGGHSLLPLMKLRLAAPSVLVDLHKVPGLAGVKVQGDRIAVGAMTTYAEILASKEIQEELPILVQASGVVGDAQVRNRGTIGGSIAHADPAADIPAVVLALDAEIKVAGANGERTIAAKDFFVDMLTTALQPDEVITEISFPRPQGKVGMAYEKFAHPASGYAITGVAAVVTLGGNGKAESVKVAVTGAGAVAKHAAAVEQALNGQELTADAVKNASQKADEGIEFLGDIHASEEYRAHLVKVFTERAINRAAERARG